MEKVTFQYCKKRVFTKPPKDHFDTQLQTTKFYLEEELTVREIFNKICEGRSWHAGFYDLETAKGFGKVNLLGIRTIALDFDEAPVSPQEVIKYAETIGFAPNFYYWSYSQGKKANNNFRIVWILKDVITKVAYETIYDILLQKTFSNFNPDPKTKDASRLWYGTVNGGELLSEDPISLENIGFLATLYELAAGKEYSKIKNNKKIYISEYSKLNVPDDVYVKPTWVDELAAVCPLWELWQAGAYLDQLQRKNLFMNLRYLKQSDNKSIIDDILRFYKPEIYIENESNFVGRERLMIEQDFRRTNPPWQIIKYNNQRFTIPEYFQLKERKVKSSRNRMDIDSFAAEMDYKVKSMLNNLKPNITYFVSQVGSGKTHRIIEWILEQNLNTTKIIYAVPTHSTAEEFEKRLVTNAMTKGINIDGCYTRIHRKNYSEYEERLLELGLPVRRKDDAHRSAQIKKLQDDNRFTSSGVFIITHQLLSRLRDINCDMIIIDEDPASSLIDTWTMNVGELPLIQNLVSSREMSDRAYHFSRDLQELVDEMDNRKTPGKVINTLELHTLLININKEKACKEIRLTSPLFKFAEVSEMYVSNLGQLCGESRSKSVDEAIAKGIPIAVFSATPMINTIQVHYGEEIINEVISINTAQNKGKVIWFSGTTGSKGRKGSPEELGENIPKLFNYAKDKLKDFHVDYCLTFKDTMDYAEEVGFKVPRNEDSEEHERIHLSNCEGLDFMSGYDIAVIGKYDLNPSYYIQIYNTKLGGVGFPSRQNQTVTVNGERVVMYLFEDPKLRAIQLENIDAVVEQAVGRARALLNEKGNVYIFSNYPVREYDIRIID